MPITHVGTDRIANLDIPAFAGDFDRTEKLLASIDAKSLKRTEGTLWVGCMGYAHQKHLTGYLNRNEFRISASSHPWGADIKAGLESRATPETLDLLRKTLTTFKPDNYNPSQLFPFTASDGEKIDIGFVSHPYGFMFDVYKDGIFLAKDLYGTNLCPNFKHVVNQVRAALQPEKPKVPVPKTSRLPRWLSFLEKVAA